MVIYLILAGMELRDGKINRFTRGHVLEPRLDLKLGFVENLLGSKPG